MYVIVSLLHGFSSNFQLFIRLILGLIWERGISSKFGWQVGGDDKISRKRRKSLELH